MIRGVDRGQEARAGHTDVGPQPVAGEVLVFALLELPAPQNDHAQVVLGGFRQAGDDGTGERPLGRTGQADVGELVAHVRRLGHGTVRIAGRLEGADQPVEQLVGHLCHTATVV